MLIMISVLVLVHAVAVVLSALYLTRRVWGWVSGPGFYVLLVPILLWALYQRFKRGKGQRDEPTELPHRERIRSRRRDGD